ncbi:MAG: T9SS type A sorting domain-containing protein [Saprospiraceae bacterium]|nr:T9SS type A sorting domain-containing protein [Saprospiraceae bacterium]
MRNLTILLFAGLAFVIMAHSSGAGAEQDKDRTGGPAADGFCSACHSGGDFAATVNLTLLGEAGDTIEQYVPGTSYTMRVEVTGTGASGFGFQAVVLDSDLASVGTYGNPEAGSRITEVAGRQYFEHNATSSSGIWEIDWTAPDEAAGDLKFYFAGNAVNGNGSRSGDRPVHDSLLVAQDQTSSLKSMTDFALRLGPVPAHDFLRIDWNDHAQPEQLEIRSVSGQMVYAVDLNRSARTASVAVATLPQGVYVLTLRSPSGLQSQRFVKH